MRFLLTLGLAGTLAALPSLAQRHDDDNGNDRAGVAEAIRWEKAKQAAADRQARIEEGRGREDRTADRMMDDRKPKPRYSRTNSNRHNPPPRHEGEAH